MSDARTIAVAPVPLCEQLQILIITYNRAPLLRRTLDQLRDSPFAGCAITILDNCSNDETQRVCADFVQQIPRLAIVRHDKNIGACPNYLRAVEMSRAAYTWVLCDDDRLDFSDCGDVIATIEAGTADIIQTGAPGDDAWPRGTVTSSHELIARRARYFHVLTFIPSTIFRTELFNSECFLKGYKNSQNLYPHFEFVRQTARDNRSVYVSKRRLVNRDPHESVPNLLYWLAGWVNSCTSIEDRALRTQVIYEVAPSRLIWLKFILIGIAGEKMQRPDRLLREVTDLLIGISFGQRLIVAAAMPLLLVPSRLFELARMLRRKIAGRGGNAERPAFDEFRT